MSTTSAGTFVPTLRRVGRGLGVPLPDRTRILRELAGDLEAFTDLLVAGGVAPDEAHRRATDALVPDAHTLDALGELHAPLYQRITRGITPERLRVAERTSLAAATLFVVVAGGLALLQANLLENAAPFLWPVLGMGVLLFVGMVAKAFQLWIKKDHRTPDTGLDALLGLCLATVLVGFVGVLFDVYRLAGALESAPDLAATLAPIWLVRDTALLSVSITIGLSGALGWFLLSQWVAVAVRAHGEILGLHVGSHRRDDPNRSTN